MATIVHAADLHLDSPPVGAERARRAWPVDVATATRQAVVRLVDLVLSERADLLIIAGDVFDRAADSEAVGRFFATQMGRLHDAGVPVLVVAGNHDVVCPRATRGPANVQWCGTEAPTTVTVDGIGVAVHGQGLADPTEPGDLAAGFPAPIDGYLNLGVLHTSLDGASSRSLCAPTSADTLIANGYDYWALGHVHRRRVVATDPWIVFPGNPQGRGPAEDGSKGATLITVDGGRVAAVEHRELAVLRWERTRVGGAGVDDALERLWADLAGFTTTAPTHLTVTGVALSPDQLRTVTRDHPHVLVDAAG